MKESIFFVPAIVAILGLYNCGPTDTVKAETLQTVLERGTYEIDCTKSSIETSGNYYRGDINVGHVSEGSANRGKALRIILGLHVFNDVNCTVPESLDDRLISVLTVELEAAQLNQLKALESKELTVQRYWGDLVNPELTAKADVEEESLVVTMTVGEESKDLTVEIKGLKFEGHRVIIDLQAPESSTTSKEVDEDSIDGSKPSSTPITSSAASLASVTETTRDADADSGLASSGNGNQEPKLLITLYNGNSSEEEEDDDDDDDDGE